MPKWARTWLFTTEDRPKKFGVNVTRKRNDSGVKPKRKPLTKSIHVPMRFGLTREENPADRREVLVRVSPDEEAKAQRIESTYLKLTADLLDRLGPD